MATKAAQVAAPAIAVGPEPRIAAAALLDIPDVDPVGTGAAELCCVVDGEAVAVVVVVP